MTIGSVRAPLALLVEALWSFAAAALFVQFFGQGDGPGPSILSVAAVVVASFVVARLLQPDSQASAGDEAARGVIVSIVGLIIIGVLTYNASSPWDFSWLSSLLSHPADAIEPNGNVIAGMIALGGLWYRGVQRGSLPELTFDGVLTSVTVGLVAVTVAALSDPDVQGNVSWGALAFAYGVLAIVTLAAFHAQPGTRLSSMAAGWPLAIAALATVALLLALVAGTVDRDAFGVLSPLGGPLDTAGRALRDYVLMPIFYVVALPFRALAWFIGLFVPDEPRQEPQMQPQPERKPPEQGDEPLWWRVLTAAGITLGGIVVAAIAVLVLYRAFRRYTRSRRHDPREVREDIEPGSSLASDLGAMLGALGRRFRRGEARSASAVAIRRLYFDMIDAAARRGLERKDAQTPSQFAPALDAQFASSVPSEISAAFVESRYGERAVDDERVRRLREQWRAVAEGP
jgi:hypothetical protein